MVMGEQTLATQVAVIGGGSGGYAAAFRQVRLQGAELAHVAFDPYPTLSETVAEAAEAFLGMATDIALPASGTARRAPRASYGLACRLYGSVSVIVW
jgi:thioredoxin reductase